MSKSPENQGGHSTGKLVAEIGSATVAVAAAGAAAYYLRKKRLKELGNREPDTLGRHARDKAAILEEPRLSPEKRQLMAEVAVRVYHATLEPKGVMMRRDLIAALPDATKRQIQTAVGYLKDNGLIEPKPIEGARGQRGYQATDALDWAMQEGNYPSLADAEVLLTGGYAGEFSEQTN